MNHSTRSTGGPMPLTRAAARLKCAKHCGTTRQQPDSQTGNQPQTHKRPVEPDTKLRPAMILIQQPKKRGTRTQVAESVAICTQVPTMVDRIRALTKGHGPALPIVLSVPQATRRMRSKGLTAAAPK